MGAFSRKEKKMAAIGINLNGAQGGSVQGSQNSSFNTANAWSNQMSQTFGAEATSAARANMEYANKLAYENWLKAAEYNSKEAQKQRDWQEQMAATNYQRTVKDMIAAGINPVLAAGAGLGADTVTSGSAASMGSPSTFMAGAYADQISSGQSASQSYGEGQGTSWGQSWNESGLATAMEQMASLISDVISSRNTATTINLITDNLKGKAAEVGNDLKSWLVDNMPWLSKQLGITYDASSSNSIHKGGNSVSRKKTVTGSGTVGGSSNNAGTQYTPRSNGGGTGF